MVELSLPSATNAKVRISCWEPRLHPSGAWHQEKPEFSLFQLRSGAARRGAARRTPEMMASSQEKATSGVLRNAAALLDEMQLMGETQGECGCYCLLCCSCKVLSYPVLSFPSGAKKVINSELWHACAGPLVCLPQRGSLVYYFPQGHSEQVSSNGVDSQHSFSQERFPKMLLLLCICGLRVYDDLCLRCELSMLKEFCLQVAATTKKIPNSRIPNYPSLPSQLLCQVHNITLHVSVNGTTSSVPNVWAILIANA